MTRDQISAEISALFGAHKGALADAARALGVNYDNLRKTLSGARPVPGHLAERIAELRRLQQITPPPATLSVDLDRDGPCGEALEPHLREIERRALAAGWHPAEVCAATLTWAIHRAINGAGIDAARSLLADVAELVDAHRLRRFTND